MLPPPPQPLNADEWSRSSDVWLMLHTAEQVLQDRRKLGLFAASCCRRHWKHLPLPSQQVLTEFEEAIDRAATNDELRAFCGQANEYVSLVPAGNRLATAAAKAVCYAVGGDPWGSYGYFADEIVGESAQQAELLRDIYGPNPFRPVAFDPDWRTSTAVALAKQMYDSRDFIAMPILADALQDAGCDNENVLTHCRDSKGVHVRGCWVVDLILGRS